MSILAWSIFFDMWLMSLSGWERTRPRALLCGTIVAWWTGNEFEVARATIACPASWNAVLSFSSWYMTSSLSGPKLTKSLALLKCSLVRTVAFSSIDPINLALFTKLAKSAPVNPIVICARVCGLMSAASLFEGIASKSLEMIFLRPSMSGGLKTKVWSNRPGRRIAGSKRSGAFVAANTITTGGLVFFPNSLVLKPSISTRSWFKVWSWLDWFGPALRLPATASISSMNITARLCFLASAKSPLTLADPDPTQISSNSAPEMAKNGTPASPATAFASIVLPTPGGPVSKYPRGMVAPNFSYFTGFFKKSTICINCSLTSSQPWTLSNLTDEFKMTSCKGLFIPPSCPVIDAPPINLDNNNEINCT